MITINIDKARQIAHAQRRAVRAEAFAPLDVVIAQQIPGTDILAAEAERQAIRDADAKTQRAIDRAKDVDALRALLP